MKKTILAIALFCLTFTAMQAQEQFDYKLVKEIVDNERTYFNDILKLYLADDPLLRTDDIALIYYGQSYLPTYTGGNDANEKALKSHVASGHQDPPPIQPGDRVDQILGGHAAAQTHYRADQTQRRYRQDQPTVALDPDPEPRCLPFHLLGVFVIQL